MHIFNSKDLVTQPPHIYLLSAHKPSSEAEVPFYAQTSIQWHNMDYSAHLTGALTPTPQPPPGSLAGFSPGGLYGLYPPPPPLPNGKSIFQHFSSAHRPIWYRSCNLEVPKSLFHLLFLCYTLLKTQGCLKWKVFILRNSRKIKNRGIFTICVCMN